jgi:phosphopantothenoylcysteine decarboxylase/phosphopantothenate--cysteine ligase
MENSTALPHIVLIIGGGIAAYKSLELIRLLRRAGMRVTPVLTAAGQQFVTPLSAAALAGEPVQDDLFSAREEARMRHIELARAASAVVVAPATADLMARAAMGIADDLATTLLLATRAPVLMAPAMNTAMWEHPATRRNVARLREDGVRFVGPEEGELACGETGSGRMAEPEIILEAVRDLIGIDGAAEGQAAAGPLARGGDGKNRPLAGARVLVTAGPTFEPVDPVRFIGNRSSGRQGYALARAAAEAGAEVTLISGPVALPCPPGVRCVRVETARDMLKAVQAALPADIAIFAAAVADWRPRQEAASKLRKAEAGASVVIELVENPDILASVGRMRAGRPAIVVGFAAETGDPVQAGRDKLRRKGADMIVANDVSPERGIFGGDENEVVLITTDGEERWPRMTKEEVARRLTDRLARMWQQARGRS